VRYAGRKRLDPAALIAIVLPAFLSLAYLPLALAGARHLEGCGSWGGGRPATLAFFPMAYAGLIPSAGLWIGLGAVALGILRVIEGEAEAEDLRHRQFGPFPHEWALAAATALLPFWVFFGTMLAGLPTGYISGYALSAVIGISLLAGLVTRGHAAAAVAVVLLLHFASHQLNSVRLYLRPPPPADAPLLEAVRQHPDLPILMDWEALPVLHYGPPDVAQRVVALRERELAHNAQCMVTLAPYAPVPFAGYEDIVARHRRFLLWTRLPSDRIGALTRRLNADGFHADLLAGTAKAELRLVSLD